MGTQGKYKSCADNWHRWMKLFTRILTENERKSIQKYLRYDGRKEVTVRKVVYGARKHLPTIKADLELLEKLIGTYEIKKRGST
jgi:hypothetical protein